MAPWFGPNSFPYNSTAGAVGTPRKTCPHGASSTRGVHGPFSAHPAQKQNPPPLQLDDEEIKPEVVTGSTPRPAASPAPSQLARPPPHCPQGFAKLLFTS